MQRGGRNLDRDFLFGQAGDVDLGDAPRQQFVFEAPGQMAQFGAVAGTGDDHPGDRVVADDAGDFGLLGGGRQIAYLIDRLLDIVQCLADVAAFLEFQAQRSNAVGRGRGEFLQPVQVTQFPFQRVGDGFLDILGGGSGPHHPHRDHV